MLIAPQTQYPTIALSPIPVPIYLIINYCEYIAYTLYIYIFMEMELELYKIKASCLFSIKI